MLSFRNHRHAHRLTAAGDLAPFILATRGEQLRVEVGEVARLRLLQHLLITFVTALVARHAAALIVNLHVARIKTDLRPSCLLQPAPNKDCFGHLHHWSLSF
jgi:hypothetical protein